MADTRILTEDDAADRCVRERCEAQNINAGAKCDFCQSSGEVLRRKVQSGTNEIGIGMAASELFECRTGEVKKTHFAGNPWNWCIAGNNTRIVKNRRG